MRTEHFIDKFEQVNHYYPFGGLMGESTNDEVQRYKYNGKELDRMHGLNLYDYGARQYDGAGVRFTTMDPLSEKYYNISPYAYCAGNPVVYVDEKGLYPKGVLIYHKTCFYRADYYTFTRPAAHLLSLVTNVREEYILGVNVMEKGLGREYPFYNPNKGGGGITIGSNPYNTTMTFTKNFFSDDADSYNGHGYGQNIFTWLNIISHEVTHINHIEKADGKFKYLTHFIVQYLKYGHDATPEEQEADKNRETFVKFNHFLNKKHGANCIQDLLNSDVSDGQKVFTIDDWWKEYEEEKKKDAL